MSNENTASNMDKILLAGEFALSVLRRVKTGEMTVEQALSDAEAQWNTAVAEAGDLRRLGHGDE